MVIWSYIMETIFRLLWRTTTSPSTKHIVWPRIEKKKKRNMRNSSPPNVIKLSNGCWDVAYPRWMFSELFLLLLPGYRYCCRVKHIFYSFWRHGRRYVLNKHYTVTATAATRSGLCSVPAGFTARRQPLRPLWLMNFCKRHFGSSIAHSFKM